MIKSATGHLLKNYSTTKSDIINVIKPKKSTTSLGNNKSNRGGWFFGGFYYCYFMGFLWSCNNFVVSDLWP
jgi:hypothetical protein